MIIELKNVFVNPKFHGERFINIKYCGNKVEISDTRGNDFCEMGVTKFEVTSHEVLFYFVHEGKIKQFLSGEISDNMRTFEKDFCKYDIKELMEIAEKNPTINY